MNPRRLHIILLSLLFWLSAAAQGEMVYTRHSNLPGLYNPARSGETDFLRIGAGTRLQWIGVHNAPKAFTGVADIPFLIAEKHRVGAGAVISQESIGLFSNLLASLQGAYRLKAFKGQLALGLRLGYCNSQFRGSKIYIPEGDDYHQPDDPHLPKEDLSGNAFDFSAGASWTNGKWHAGLSALHINGPNVNLRREGNENSESQEFQTHLSPTLYFEAGGNIKLPNSLFLMQPSLLVASDFSSYAAVASLSATYNRFLSAGLAYRLNDAIGIILGAEFKNFSIGYAFDWPTSSLGRASAGSHEITASYRLKLNLSGPNKNRHRSIRIMQ